MSSALSDGSTCFISAATPATMGEEKLLSETVVKDPPLAVVPTFSPGASRSSRSPRWVKVEMLSAVSTDPTETTLGSAAGHSIPSP